MFWGLIMEPQRRYTQQVKKAFHVSMAALDVLTSSNEPAQVMCGFEGRNYLLCTLQKPDMLQCPLDLNFDVGSEVSFAANGNCHVHLTGYLTEEFPDSSEEEEEEESVSFQSKKRSKKPLENGSASKKLKKSDNQEKNSDSDDSDLDVNALFQKSFPESDDDSDASLEEEDEEQDEEESDELDEETSLSEEDPIETDFDIVKMNGVPKKQEKAEKANMKGRDEKQKKEGKNKKSTKGSDDSDEKKSTNKENQITKRVVHGGVVIEDLREGQGPPAKKGQTLFIYYQCRLKNNNKLIDSVNDGSGFRFKVGQGVVKGLSIGALGMKPGGKRRVTCPPAMAYGPKGDPPTIPANSTLVFEIELKKIAN